MDYKNEETQFFYLPASFPFVATICLPIPQCMQSLHVVGGFVSGPLRFGQTDAYQEERWPV